MKQPFYITTTLPYINAKPHIGFALEIIQADVIARLHDLAGDEVFFNYGTDEHGLKVYRKAAELGMDVQAYCDEQAKDFFALKDLLHIWDGVTFIRTTDKKHVAAAQAFWKLCEKNGDIYKKEYHVKYCVGCELEKTDSELEDGTCPIHPNLEIELIEEENYFFRFSAYQDALLDLYETQSDIVLPAHRLHEIKNFVAAGLQDFSISRLKEKMPWGVPVPGDEEHVIYVWFDALVNYISTIGWPKDMDTFQKFWPAVQMAGKDNLRQQSAMWQAMLMSAGIKPSKQIFIHGFITSEGKKMSKSLGNVVDPYEIVEKYGIDPVRYYLLGAMPAAEDGDFSVERFEEFYTAHLANGVGNLTSRVLTMLEKYSDGLVPEGTSTHDAGAFWDVYAEYAATFQFDSAVVHIQTYAQKLDVLINDTKPWEKAKTGEDISDILYTLAESLRMIAVALLPIIPESAEKILNSLGVDIKNLESLDVEKEWGRLKAGAKVKKGDPLFPRLS